MNKHTKLPWTKGGSAPYGWNLYAEKDVWIGTIHNGHTSNDSRPVSGFPSDNEGEANINFLLRAVNAQPAIEAFMEHVADTRTFYKAARKAGNAMTVDEAFSCLENLETEAETLLRQLRKGA